MQNYKEIKVVLLGDTGAGKSSLIQRFVNDEFRESFEPTLGAAFSSKNFNRESRCFRFQIWDTAGQEKYRSLAPLYYKDAHVALIVFDITNKDSFDSTKSWVKDLNDNVGQGKVLIFLVGNKSDLISQAKVSYNDGKNLQQELKAQGFKMTSAKESTNITDLFNEICDNIIKVDDQRDQMKTRGSLSPNPPKSTLKLQHVDPNQKQQTKKDSGCC